MKGLLDMFSKNVSLVKKFAKGAPVSVERGGDPSNAPQHGRGELKTGSASYQNEIEVVAERLAEASRNYQR
nr:MAG TPA: hypothetical protein [Caudoviricetes sp.]